MRGRIVVWWLVILDFWVILKDLKFRKLAEKQNGKEEGSWKQKETTRFRL